MDESVGKVTGTVGLLTAFPAATLAFRDWRKVALSGGHAHGTWMGFPSAPLTAPSQFPVPVGLSPAWPPSSGTRAGSTTLGDPLETGAREVDVGAGADDAGAARTGVADAEAAGAGAAGAGAAVPAAIAFACACSVVLTIGHPFPTPFKFCNVIDMAVIRASWEAMDESVGKVTGTVGLLTAFPAATLALRDWRKMALSGGHAQGTWMGLPSAPLTAPSQFPVPVGFNPAWPPSSGTRAGSTSLLEIDTGAQDTDATRTIRDRIELVNFMFDKIKPKQKSQRSSKRA